MVADTVAYVDFGALGRNLAAIKAHTGKPLLLPVKANAYGHGLVPVARQVEAAGWADWLAVATVAEGIALREAGVGLPILKLSGLLPDQAEAAVGAGLRLTVVDSAGIAAAQAAAAALGVIAPVHLKVDTGMRRIGCPPELAPDLALAVEAAPNLDLEGVFTHFAVSDEPAEDDFTALQLTRFTAAVAAVQDRLARRVPIVHAANSGAVLAHPAAWFDLVRPGILSYGYYPGPDTPRTIPAEPVLSLRSRLTFVKTVAAGETVSYGRTWTAPRDTRIGTVPVGYGDGYLRLLSNRAEVLVGGSRRPQAGRICMDQFMVDLGPDSPAQAGDDVTLIGRDGGERIGADELADLVGTISYEVLCAVAARVPREYVT